MARAIVEESVDNHAQQYTPPTAAASRTTTATTTTTHRRTRTRCCLGFGGSPISGQASVWAGSSRAVTDVGCTANASPPSREISATTAFASWIRTSAGPSVGWSYVIGSYV
jgi:hypothetical protein